MAAVANVCMDSRSVERRSTRGDQQFRSILFDSIRRARMERLDVAKRMTELSGTAVSLNSLNQWLAPGRETGRMPAILLPFFCAAVGDDSALRFLLGEELLKFLELGEVVGALLSKPAALANARRRRSQLAGNSALPIFDEPSTERKVV